MHTPRQDKHGVHDHHAHMEADFRQRFWISQALTVPILALSPRAVGHARPGGAGNVSRRRLCTVRLPSIVFFYGGWAFLTRFAEEFRKRQPGMMTLIAVAISAASSAVTFGLPGMGFYWELSDAD